MKKPEISPPSCHLLIHPRGTQDKHIHLSGSVCQGPIRKTGTVGVFQQKAFKDTEKNSRQRWWKSWQSNWRHEATPGLIEIMGRQQAGIIKFQRPESWDRTRTWTGLPWQEFGLWRGWLLDLWRTYAYLCQRRDTTQGGVRKKHPNSSPSPTCQCLSLNKLTQKEGSWKKSLGGGGMIPEIKSRGVMENVSES